MTNIANLLTEHIDIWTAAESEKKSGRGNTSSNSSGVYGIKKLRELILELAISGKIVNSEESWKQTKLGDLGAWAIGGGFPTAEQGSPNGNILFTKVSDMNNIGNEKFIFHTNNTITEEVAKKLKANIHPEGTVIFPKIGGAIATNKRRILVKPTAIDNNCLGISPKNGVTTDWLYLVLSAIDLSKYQAGTSVPALAQGVLKEIQVMLPSVSEQKRVVAKVDELMALCDQLEQQHSNAQEAHETLVSQLLATLTQSQNAAEFNANWQRIYAHFDVLFTTEASIDALKQTLLQLAVMGKLVPQDPNDEPASELLKRIQAEKAKLIAEGKLKKEKPLTPSSEDEKTFELPKGWEWSSLEVVIQLVSGQHLIPEEYFETDSTDSIPYITGPADFGDLGPVPTRFTKEKRAVALNGDILVTVKGSGVGKTNVVTQNELAISRQLMAIRPVQINRKFIKLLLETNANYFLSLSIGIAIPGISREDINSLGFGLPPLAEQHRIVAKVDALMALCDQLKTHIQQANQQQQAITDALVAQALKPASAEVLDLAAYRAAITCNIIKRMQHNQAFGRTFAMKLLYLSQQHIGFETHLEFEREAAGPFDKWIYDFERNGVAAGWFVKEERQLSNGYTKIEYQVKSAIDEPLDLMNHLGSKEQRKELERLFALFADKKTEEAEIVATLFAAWNDFLLNGMSPTDAQIIQEVRENWHPAKAKFLPEQLKQWLDWLRDNNIVPTGKGCKTIYQKNLLQ